MFRRLEDSASALLLSIHRLLRCRRLRCRFPSRDKLRHHRRQIVMLSILRLSAQRGHVDHMRVRVKAPSIHARNIACRGDGDQHLVLPHRKIEDLPRRASSSCANTSSRITIGLLSKCAETASYSAIFNAKAMVHISPLDANSRAFISLSSKVRSSRCGPIRFCRAPLRRGRCVGNGG